MKNFTLKRLKSDDQGIFGILSDGIFTRYVIELPWRDNQSNLSCIPLGEYLVTPYTSRKFGNVHLLTNVLQRSFILLHTGNYAGDTTKGFLTHSHGCILLGRKCGILKNQKAVLLSRMAMNDFNRYIGKEKFKLSVKGDMAA